ncbi:MAG: lytic murein transglycosylase [bacterium]
MKRSPVFFVIALFLLPVVLLAVSGAGVPQTLAQELTPAERAELQKQYDQLQVEIAAQQKIVTETQAKKNTLKGNVTQLDAQIKAAQAQIAAKTVTIKQLGSEIASKNKTITTLANRIEAGKESLAGMLRQESQLDDSSLAEIAFANEDISSFFADVDAFVSIKREMQALFSDIKVTKAQTQAEREALAKKQNATQDAKYAVETTKQQIAVKEAEQQQLLAITTNQEAQYQEVLAAKQAKAAAIRAALFPLRDTGAIPFGDAVVYAKTAAAKTGVRAAMILAILSQESALGTNVGNCLVTDLTTGDGKGKNTGTPFSGVMKAPRDTVPFARITAALGKDWRTTPVSCPQPGGYGGAMGPTQFIPSTWELFEGRIEAALGVPATNPWNAEHAIMATALYLQDVGAAGGTYTAEQNAACRYYSGGACSGGAISAYGASVVAKAAKYQQDIDFLADNS